jgi:DNA-binding response OmpR family regulator
VASRIEFSLLAIWPFRRTFTRAQFIDRLQLRHDGFDRSIDAHIRTCAASWNLTRLSRYVLTVYGVGYQFNAER